MATISQSAIESGVRAVTDEEDDFFRSFSQSATMGRVASKLLRDRDVRW